MEEKRRERYLDVVKAAGAVAIVALHTLSNTANTAGYIPDTRRLAFHVIHQFLYSAVPVFMLATGAGFLSSGRDNGYKGMARHIVKVAVCILVFGFLFGGIKMLADGEPLRLGALCVRILTDSTWTHMWYLYRLLGIYLCMPWISAFMNHAGIKEQLVFAGVLLWFCCIYPYAAGLAGFIPAEVMPVSGMWIFYVVAGGLLGKVENMGKYRLQAGAATLLAAAAVVWQGLQGTEYVLSETHPFEMLLAVSLFADIRILCGERSSAPWLRQMAQAALGIYVIHPVFIHICVKLLHFNPQHHMPLLTLPLSILVIFSCSAVVTVILRKVPFVRKYLL